MNRPAANASIIPIAIFAFLLVAVLGIGISIIGRYRKRMREDEKPVDLLASLQDAYDEGELDTAEFNRVREVLANKPTATGDEGKVPPVPRF